MAADPNLIVQHSPEWLAVANPEALAVARSQGSLDVVLGMRSLHPGESFQDPAPVVQRDQAWLDAHKADTNEIVRAMGAGELRELLGGA